MELGTLIQYFKADLSDFDKGLNRADQRMASTKSSFSKVLDDITGDISSKFGVGGKYVNNFVNDLSSGSEKSAQAAQKLRAELKGLEEQALRVRNRFADFSQGLNLSFGGKIDTGFLKQFREAENESAKLSLLTQRFGKDAAAAFAPVEKAAFQFSKLERDGGRALEMLEGKSAKLTKELASVEQEVAAAGEGFAAFAGPVGVALAVVAGLTAATVGLGVGLFELSKDTASFGAGLSDLSQKSGLSVELLSTLKVAAELSGSSIEGANTALVRYLKAVSDVNHGNTELEKKFKQVGFTAADLKKAYSSPDAAIQLLITHIGDLANSEDRLNALTKIGVRNGEDLNGILGQMGNNLAEFQAKAAALSLVITPEQAAQADKFDDSLVLLQLQFKALTYTVGREFMPEFQTDMNLVSQTMTELRDPVRTTAGIARLAFESITDKIKEAVAEVTVFYNLLKQAPGFGDGFAFLGAALTPPPAIRNVDIIGPFGGKPGGSKLGDKEDTSKETAAQRATRQALQIAQVDLQQHERIYREKTEDEQRAYQESQRALKDYSTNRLSALKDLHEAEKAVFAKERNEIASSNLEAGEKKVRLRNLKEDEAAAASNYERTATQIQHEEDKAREEMAKAHAASLLQIDATFYAAQEAQDRSAAEHRILSFADVEKRHFDNQIKLLGEQAEALEKERDRAAVGSPGRAKAEDALAQINEQEKALQAGLGAALAKARADDLAETQSYANRLRGIYDQITSSINERTAIEIGALDGDTFRRKEQIEKQRKLDRDLENERFGEALRGLRQREKVLDDEIAAIKDFMVARAEEYKKGNISLAALNKETEGAQRTIDKRLAEKRALDAEIIEQERTTQARLNDIDRRAAEQRAEQARQIAQELSNTLADAIDAGIEKGAGAGFKSLAQSALDTIRQIERELLNSVIADIFTGKKQGSNAGGIVGAATNKLLDLLGLGTKKGAKDDPNAVATEQNTNATDENTQALKALTDRISSSAFSDQESPSDISTAVNNGTARVVSGIRSLQSVMEMLIPHQQGFWGGLLNAVVGGAIGGAVGSIGAGGGSGGTPATGSFAYEPDANFGNIPFLGAFGARTPGHANGGGFGPNEEFWVGEQGPEKVRTGDASGVVFSHPKSKQESEGQSVNFHPNSINVHVNLPSGYNPNAFPQRNRRMIAEAAAEGLTDALEHKYGR